MTNNFLPMVASTFFNNRKMLVCTMHGKNQVMSPLIKKYLNLDSEVVPGIDTDVFGTFSGEVERPFDPITTLRLKIKKGLEQSHATLGIGNEGSFGAHPQIPFVHADQEIVMMIDLENDLEIVEFVTSTDTNFASLEINSDQELDDFAKQVHFPSHGLILKQIQAEKTVAIEKGIISWNHLHEVMMKFKRNRNEGVITVETDMRAHLNPTRMKVIGDATERLMKKILSTCPVCQWPGFGEAEVKYGLPCSWCGTPTRMVSSVISRCKRCNHENENVVNQKTAEPQYCDYCNP